MTPPSYTSREDCPGVFFECTRLRGSVSTEWCARQWREVSAAPSNTLHARWASCRRCAIGALHAGVAADERPSAVAEMRFCVRCLAESARIIRGRLCVSCYNREGEYRVGRNAKGKRPVQHPELIDVRLVVTYPDGSRPSGAVVIKDCTFPLEGVLRALRNAGPGAAIGFPGPSLMPAQTEATQ